jgi:hypothetical protein
MTAQFNLSNTQEGGWLRLPNFRSELSGKIRACAKHPLDQIPVHFLFILSFISGEHLNVITVLASRVKSSPVIGFLPFR